MLYDDLAVLFEDENINDAEIDEFINFEEIEEELNGEVRFNVSNENVYRVD